MKPYLLQFYAISLSGPDQLTHDQISTDCLRDHGSQCNSGYAKAGHTYQKHIQDHI